MKTVSMFGILCVITVLVALTPAYGEIGYTDSYSNEDTYGGGSLSGWGSGVSHTAGITINNTYLYSTSCGSGERAWVTDTAGTFCGDYHLSACASALVYLGGTTSTTYTLGGADVCGYFSSYANALSPRGRVELTGISKTDSKGQNPRDVFVSEYAYFSANTGVTSYHQVWAAGNISTAGCGASGQAQGYGYAISGMCN